MTHGSRLLPFDRTERRAAVTVGAPLAPLADSLAADLEPLLAARELPIPMQKARLTRAGGRCPSHGVYLAFEPWSPHAHRCPRCGEHFTGREHDDWWAMGAQLWTVERAVHAAALYAVRGDERHAALSARILGELASRYLSWPNNDNVLGPTRPFFSTYLESIWLLNVCHALALLEGAHAPQSTELGSRVREQLIAPSASLIASYHEAASNRQVWNEVAVLSALAMLGEEQSLQARIDAPNGLPWLMAKGLLEDGTWYEGENYHLFAHRGLWYGVQLWRALNVPLSPNTDVRFRRGFLAPFAGVLPDETLPSRRDSQYGVSIRQWRIAEWCELGYAYAPSPDLAGVLTGLYDGSGARRISERSRSTADAERQDAPTALTRADLSWRALLMATVEPAPAHSWAPASACLASQGLAVLRRDRGAVYVALEGGHTGGGHGHPDRLALTLQTGHARWLEDPGTGSYVERALHWYRSTLAHHAPLVNGQSQRSVDAEIVAFEDRGGAGWVRKRVTGLAPGVNAERTVVVCDGYLVDVLEWEAAGDITMALPICTGADILSSGSVSGWRADDLPEVTALEDGFDFVQHAERRDVAGTCELAPHATSVSGEPCAVIARCWYAATQSPCLVRAVVPGPPGQPSRARHWLETRGARGRIVGVWSWSNDSAAALAAQEVVLNAAQSPHVRVVTRDGTRAAHSAVAHGWHIDLLARHARSSIDLEGLITNGPHLEYPRAVALKELVRLSDGASPPRAWHRRLAEAAYVRTEPSWAEAGAPVAELSLAATPHEFILEVRVTTGHVPVAAPGGNLLDNERPGINGDGLQWYLGLHDTRWHAGGLVYLDRLGGSLAHSESLVPGAKAAPAVEWESGSIGWTARLVWQRSDIPTDSDGRFRFALAVNERPLERERRRGQLVLGGDAGFGYLRGDRLDPEDAVMVSIGSSLE